MNWQVIVRNQWFQLCLAAALCSAGAGIYDLATSTPKNSSPSPGPAPVQYITPRPSLNPSPVFVQLRAKNAGRWIVDASGAGDSDSRNLAQVVGSAANGDTVTIRPGRYEASLFINKDLAFIGSGTSPAETMIFINQDQLNVVHINVADLSAQTAGRDTDVRTVPLEVFDRTIAVNLRGHLIMTKRVLPELLSAGGGSIVYTASAGALVGGTTRAAYGMSKAGVLALSRQVATTWGKDGIRSNVVAPGLILTEHVLERDADGALREQFLQTLPSRRLGEPEDIAAAVTFLLLFVR